MNKLEIKKYVEENPSLVSMRESPAYPGLFVLKYKKRVFFDSLWNDFLEECRGTIVDKDFNVVSRPFTKIYNYGVEEKSPKIDSDTPIAAFRKINGFMVAMTWYDNDILVSTTGSMDSDYVGYAKEMMLKHAPMEEWKNALLSSSGYTLMFECCHASDPHIVPEEAGLYFIGYRENAWDSKVESIFGNTRLQWYVSFALSILKCYYAECMMTTMGQLVELSKTVQHEGFVFYTEDGVSAKIKSPFYLVNKWMARNPRTDKLLTKEFKEQIDEEYYPLLDHIRENIVEYTAMDEQQRLAWIRKFL